MALEWDKPGKTGEEESADKERIIGAKKTNQLALCREEAGRLFLQIGNQTIFKGIFSLVTILPSLRNPPTRVTVEVHEYRCVTSLVPSLYAGKMSA